MTKLNKTAKLEYFNNLKLGKDNKPFWEKCKPYFTNKHSKADTDIMLDENGEFLLKDKDAADTFNEYFGSIVESLDLCNWESAEKHLCQSLFFNKVAGLTASKSEINDLGLNDSNQDYLDIIIRKHEKYSSIQMIKQNFRFLKTFHFNLSPRMRSKR